VAVAAVLAIGRPQPPDPGIAVLAISHDLPAGTVLASQDLRIVRLPTVPDGALVDPATARGRTLSAPVRKGEIVTDARITPPAGPDPGPGRVAVPIRLADQATTTLLQPGAHVTVLVVDDGGAPRRLTTDAVVLAVPGANSNRTAGPAIGAAAGQGERLAIVAVPERDADALAAAALIGEIAVRFS